MFHFNNYWQSTVDWVLLDGTKSTNVEFEIGVLIDQVLISMFLPKINYLENNPYYSEQIYV